MLRLISIVCLVGLLAACAASGPRYLYLHDAVHEGDILVVERALRARGLLIKEVYLRDGRPIGFFNEDKRQIKCRLRVYDLPDSDTVDRTRFTIERVRSTTYGGSSADETDTMTRIELAGAGATSAGFFMCSRTIDNSDFKNVPTYITFDETLRAVGPYIAFETADGARIDLPRGEGGG